MNQMLVFVLMIASALVCGINVGAYAIFFRRFPGHGNAIQTLWCATYLISSLCEATKIEGLLTGRVFVIPSWIRIAVALMVLAVGVYQLLAFVFYYVPLQKRLLAEEKREGM